MPPYHVKPKVSTHPQNLEEVNTLLQFFLSRKPTLTNNHITTSDNVLASGTQRTYNAKYLQIKPKIEINSKKLHN